MKNDSTTAVLVFENVEFDVVDLHNMPWLRLPQIGAALDYANPYKLQQLYDRNADEFTDEMTRVIDLPTAGGIQPVRIFSLRGCHLLGMLARTERAKAFRVWVLDVLEGRAVPREAKPMTIPQTIAMHRLHTSILKDLERSTAEGMRNAMYSKLCHVAGLLALPVPPMESIGRTVNQPELPGV